MHSQVLFTRKDATGDTVQAGLAATSDRCFVKVNAKSALLTPEDARSLGAALLEFADRADEGLVPFAEKPGETWGEHVERTTRAYAPLIEASLERFAPKKVASGEQEGN